MHSHARNHPANFSRILRFLFPKPLFIDQCCWCTDNRRLCYDFWCTELKSKLSVCRFSGCLNWTNPIENIPKIRTDNTECNANLFNIKNNNFLKSLPLFYDWRQQQKLDVWRVLKMDVITSFDRFRHHQPPLSIIATLLQWSSNFHVHRFASHFLCVKNQRNKQKKMIVLFFQGF